MKRMLAVVLVLGIASMAMASDLVWTLSYNNATGVRNAANTGFDTTAVVFNAATNTFTKGPTWAAGDRIQLTIGLTYTPSDFVDSKTSTPYSASNGMNLQVAGLNVTLTGGLTSGIATVGQNAFKAELTSPAGPLSDPGSGSYGNGGNMSVVLGDAGASTSDLQDMLLTVGDSSDLAQAGNAADIQLYQAGSAYPTETAGVIRIAWDGTTASTLFVDSVQGAANLSAYVDNATGGATALGQYIASSTPSATFSFAVPEPVTMVLLGVGALFLRRR